uniref:Interleukin n=1 Tax=Poecilia latipinna TaxID=48699 RepID=A0A3B3UC72_9TELE
MEEKPSCSWLRAAFLSLLSLVLFQQKCPTAALSCFADELSVLCEEMKVSSLNCTEPKLSQSLRKLAKKFKKSESDCRPCELYLEKSPKDFLIVLLNVLQWINSKNCRGNAIWTV